MQLLHSGFLIGDISKAINHVLYLRILGTSRLVAALCLRRMPAGPGQAVCWAPHCAALLRHDLRPPADEHLPGVCGVWQPREALHSMTCLQSPCSAGCPTAVLYTALYCIRRSKPSLYCVRRSECSLMPGSCVGLCQSCCAGASANSVPWPAPREGSDYKFHADAPSSPLSHPLPSHPTLPLSRR